MSTETQIIVAADGARSELKVYTTEPESTAPVLIGMPAMGVRAGFYHQLASALVDQKLNVVLADLRGTGSSSVRPSRSIDFGYHQMLSYDWPAVVRAVRQRFVGNQLFFLGHSLGGQLSCLHQARAQADDRKEELVSGIILIAAPLVHFTGWPFPRDLAFLCVAQLTVAVAYVVGHFPGEHLHFGGRQPRTIMRDWARAVRTGQYRPSGSQLDYHQLLNKLNLPILSLSFAADGFAPLAATRALCAQMPRASIRQVQYGTGDQGGKPLDHFNWIAESSMLSCALKRWVMASLSP